MTWDYENPNAIRTAKKLLRRFEFEKNMNVDYPFIGRIAIGLSLVSFFEKLNKHANLISKIEKQEEFYSDIQRRFLP